MQRAGDVGRGNDDGVGPAIGVRLAVKEALLLPKRIPPGLRALVIDKRIKVATPIIASPYWDDVPQDVPTADLPEVQQALASYSREYSPAYFLDRFFPRAILIQIGGQDDHLNPERVRHFHHELASYYEEAPARLAFIVEQDAAHEFTPTMWTNAVDWIQKYL